MMVKDWLIKMLESESKIGCDSNSPMGKLPEVDIYYPKGYADYVRFALKNLDVVDVVVNPAKESGFVSNHITIRIEIPLTYVTSKVYEAKNKGKT